MIGLEKWQQLRTLMSECGIEETDLIEKFIIGSGSGGQKLHKTASCVYLQHRPSGIEIKCQQTRSQQSNRYYARQRLCERLIEQNAAEKSKRQQEHEKIKRQKRRRSRRVKQKILEAKHQRAEVKSTRKKPSAED